MVPTSFKTVSNSIMFLHMDLCLNIDYLDYWLVTLPSLESILKGWNLPNENYIWWVMPMVLKFDIKFWILNNFASYLIIIDTKFYMLNYKINIVMVLNNILYRGTSFEIFGFDLITLAFVIYYKCYIFLKDKILLSCKNVISSLKLYD